MADTPITLGGIEASKPESRRLSMLLWGMAGVGKTTLASTLPGRKALISFDPDGSASIPDADDVTVFDFSGTTDSIAVKLLSSDPLGIKSVLDDFDSFIIDSLTTIEERNLGYGISQTKGATVIRPSPGAYGARGAITLNFVRNMLAITAEKDKHICFIAHEAPPTTNDDGNIINISLALGGKTPQQVALRVNECWAMFETASRKKMISIRKSRLREPIKTRMFDTQGEPEFEWVWDTHDRHDPKNMYISQWFDDWKANNFTKLPLPKG